MSRNIVVSLLCAACLGVSAACHTDTSEPSVAKLNSRPVLSTTASVDDSAATEILPTTQGNRYSCSTSTDKDFTGHYTHSRITLPANYVSGTPDSTTRLGYFRYARWKKANKRKAFDILCVVPMTNAGVNAAKAFIAELDAGPNGVPNAFAPASASRIGNLQQGGATKANGFGSDWITCFYNEFDDTMLCNGVTCYGSGATLRANLGADSTFAAVAGGDVYTCPNGCTVYRFDHFECDDGSTGGAGPGSLCLSSDPGCNQRLTPLDSAAIRTAQTQYMRSLSQIADPTARARCEEMQNRFLELLNAGADGPEKLFRGGWTSGVQSQLGHHSGAWDPNTLTAHIEPWVLDSAINFGQPRHLRELADVLLHESAHSLGYDHEPEPVFVWNSGNLWGTVYFYDRDYFNQLKPGANSCLAY